MSGDPFGSDARLQLARLEGQEDGGSVGTARAESTAELLCAELSADGLPVDASGKVVDRANNPTGLVQFKDTNGDGDVFADSFLVDSRLRPMPHPGATKKVDRYSVVIPPGTRCPVAVSTTIYYQSVEAIVAQKFLGNMTDTNNNMVLEPCVLGGRCDGRKSRNEPAVVEGAPPVPMAVRSFTIAIDSYVFTEYSM